jgi:protocatechuate 3,4-dioxygenase beta subunit
MTDAPRLSRRQALALVAITAAGGTLMSQASFAQEASANMTTAGGLMPGADVCVITPEVTEGPYYFDPALERLDITEGRPGVPTRIRLQVVDGACQPLARARVDIWHCDATGLYSGYAGQGEDGTVTTEGETFMRGTQFTTDAGMVEFETVYPGWYRGRTTHVHFKIFLDQTTVLTGQIFFPDALSQYLYENVPPYDERGVERDTVNATDGIAAQATRGSFAYVKEMSDAYLVAMIVGVDPMAVSIGGGGPGDALGSPPPSGSAPGGMGGPPPEAGVGSAEPGSLIPGTK